eukprot:gene10637-3260_t
MSEKQKILDMTNYPKIYAASSFGMSVSDFSKLCKTHGIERWPYHSKKKHEDIKDVPFKTFKVNPQAITKKRKSEKVIPNFSKKTPICSIEEQLKKMEVDTRTQSKKTFNSLFDIKGRNEEKQQVFITQQQLFLQEQKKLMEQKNAQPKIPSMVLPSFKEFLGTVESMKNKELS